MVMTGKMYAVMIMSLYETFLLR